MLRKSAEAEIDAAVKLAGLINEEDFRAEAESQIAQETNMPENPSEMTEDEKTAYEAAVTARVESLKDAKEENAKLLEVYAAAVNGYYVTTAMKAMENGKSTQGGSDQALAAAVSSREDLEGKVVDSMVADEVSRRTDETLKVWEDSGIFTTQAEEEIASNLANSLPGPLTEEEQAAFDAEYPAAVEERAKEIKIERRKEVEDQVFAELDASGFREQTAAEIGQLPAQQLLAKALEVDVSFFDPVSTEVASEKIDAQKKDGVRTASTQAETLGEAQNAVKVAEKAQSIIGDSAGREVLNTAGASEQAVDAAASAINDFNNSEDGKNVFKAALATEQELIQATKNGEVTLGKAQEIFKSNLVKNGIDPQTAEEIAPAIGVILNPGPLMAEIDQQIDKELEASIENVINPGSQGETAQSTEGIAGEGGLMPSEDAIVAASYAPPGETGLPDEGDGSAPSDGGVFPVDGIAPPATPNDSVAASDNGGNSVPAAGEEAQRGRSPRDRPVVVALGDPSDIYGGAGSGEAEVPVTYDGIDQANNIGISNEDYKEAVDSNYRTKETARLKNVYKSDLNKFVLNTYGTTDAKGNKKFDEAHLSRPLPLDGNENTGSALLEERGKFARDFRSPEKIAKSIRNSRNAGLVWTLGAGAIQMIMARQLDKIEARKFGRKVWYRDETGRLQQGRLKTSARYHGQRHIYDSEDINTNNLDSETNIAAYRLMLWGGSTIASGALGLIFHGRTSRMSTLDGSPQDPRIPIDKKKSSFGVMLFGGADMANAVRRLTGTYADAYQIPISDFTKITDRTEAFAAGYLNFSNQLDKIVQMNGFTPMAAYRLKQSRKQATNDYWDGIEKQEQASSQYSGVDEAVLGSYLEWIKGPVDHAGAISDLHKKATIEALHPGKNLLQYGVSHIASSMASELTGMDSPVLKASDYAFTGILNLTHTRNTFIPSLFKGMAIYRERDMILSEQILLKTVEGGSAKTADGNKVAAVSGKSASQGIPAGEKTAVTDQKSDLAKAVDKLETRILRRLPRGNSALSTKNLTFVAAVETKKAIESGKITTEAEAAQFFIARLKTGGNNIPPAILRGLVSTSASPSGLASPAVPASSQPSSEATLASGRNTEYVYRIMEREQGLNFSGFTTQKYMSASGISVLRGYDNIATRTGNGPLYIDYSRLSNKEKAKLVDPTQVAFKGEIAGKEKTIYIGLPQMPDISGDQMPVSITGNSAKTKRAIGDAYDFLAKKKYITPSSDGNFRLNADFETIAQGLTDQFKGKYDKEEYAAFAAGKVVEALRKLVKTEFNMDGSSRVTGAIISPDSLDRMRQNGGYVLNLGTFAGVGGEYDLTFSAGPGSGNQFSDGIQVNRRDRSYTQYGNALTATVDTYKLSRSLGLNHESAQMVAGEIYDLAHYTPTTIGVRETKDLVAGAADSSAQAAVARARATNPGITGSELKNIYDYAYSKAEKEAYVDVDPETGKETPRTSERVFTTFASQTARKSEGFPAIVIGKDGKPVNGISNRSQRDLGFELTSVVTPGTTSMEKAEHRSLNVTRDYFNRGTDADVQARVVAMDNYRKSKVELSEEIRDKASAELSGQAYTYETLAEKTAEVASRPEYRGRLRVLESEVLALGMGNDIEAMQDFEGLGVLADNAVYAGVNQSTMKTKLYERRGAKLYLGIDESSSRKDIMGVSTDIAFNMPQLDGTTNFIGQKIYTYDRGSRFIAQGLSVDPLALDTSVQNVDGKFIYDTFSVRPDGKTIDSGRAIFVRGSEEAEKLHLAAAQKRDIEKVYYTTGGIRNPGSDIKPEEEQGLSRIAKQQASPVNLSAKPTDATGSGLTAKANENPIAKAPVQELGRSGKPGAPDESSTFRFTGVESDGSISGYEMKGYLKKADPEQQHRYGINNTVLMQRETNLSSGGGAGDFTRAITVAGFTAVSAGAIANDERLAALKLTEEFEQIRVENLETKIGIGSALYSLGTDKNNLGHFAPNPVNPVIYDSKRRTVVEGQSEINTLIALWP
ncbi:MAG: hypothetical protein HQL27_08425 [Candidatus Omnitrophica bacterium]|nr:hypothetical protein [Candidatus Omnitrophota bacterium]